MGLSKNVILLMSSLLIGVVFITAFSTHNGLCQTNDEESKLIKIGIMLSADPDKDTLSREALITVQYLAEKINKAGGIDGHKVGIYYRSGEGDWGISSKKTIELIFDEEVHAIIGSMDGQNAHLTQMAITKAEVVYIETRATDPTLSEINIPWFFRVIPSDKQQAEALFTDIFIRRELNHIGIIAVDEYDNKMAANTFKRLASEQHQYSTNMFYYQQNENMFDEIIRFLSGDDVEGAVYFGPPQHLNKFLEEMDQNNLYKPIFLPLSDPVYLAAASDSKQYSELYYLCSQNTPYTFDTNFSRYFVSVMGYEPGKTAAFIYDGFNILIKSIEMNGKNNREIRDQLSRLLYTTGTTGEIRFHKNGDPIVILNVCNI